MLLLASYVFYGAWDWRYLSLIWVSTAVDYICALNIEKSKSVSKKKIFLILSLISNLGLLGTFKYYDFFAQNFQDLMTFFGLTVQPYFLQVALPIGISFYTFQTMSYTIDVYRGKLKACENILDFALYVAFFPQLIAGPIERATKLLPQILQPRTVTFEKFLKGTYYFFWGLFLKIFIADNLSKIVDPTFNSSGPYAGSDVLLATYAFSFQIYCDFAGYSIMAIGLSLTMGIELMENFRRPYFANNISEFWRRWHISLSTWLRDYLYIPLGGNKKGDTRTFMHILITMTLGGLWHGVGWTYCLFGVYHGVLIGGYHLVKDKWNKLNFYLQIFVTYHLICGGWLIFRATSLGQALDMFDSLLFNFNPLIQLGRVYLWAKILVLVTILITVQIFQELKDDSLVVLRMPRFFRYSFVIFLGYLILLFGAAGDKQFIYFQF